MKRSLLAAAAATALFATASGTAFATTDATSQRLAGTTRYGTAAAVATQPGYQIGGTSVVVTSGESYPDALAASTLASPVVLTASTGLSSDAKAALQSLKASRPNAIVVGGTASLPESIVAEVRALGFQVRRIAGTDRYDTAALVAQEHTPVVVNTKKTAIVVTGREFTDALAAAPAGLPVLLTEAKSVPAPTSKALDTLGIQQVIVVGGTDSVADATLQTLGNSNSRTVTRVAGPNAAATAAAVAEWEVFVLGWTPSTVILSSSLLFPDGLSGGALGAALKAPVLMAGFGLPSETTAFIDAHSKTVNKVIALGGTRSVDDASVTQAIAAAKNTAND